MIARLFLLLALCFGPIIARAYPPAPFHRVYGTVRDEHGNPLATGVGTIILSGNGDQEIVRGISDTSGIGPGINYSLPVPIDSGTTAQLYAVSALRPLLPFTIRVVIENVFYVPIEMSGKTWTIGTSSDSTRINLTLGVDSDGDGLPDAWELDAINSDTTGKLKSLADVKPGDDLDSDGLTNLQEYIAGTYPLERSDGLSLKIVDIKDGFARLRFLATSGRTYSISSSANVANFGPQAFSTAPTGASPTLFYQSNDVRYMDVYVPVEIGSPSVSATAMFFRLQVQ